MTKRNRRTARQRKSTRRDLWIVGIVGIALLSLGLIAAIASRDDPAGVQTFDDQGNAHIPAPAEAYIYNSRPPTSGPHSPGIADWGEHFEPVIEWNQVHNLEDGGVIMHYNCPDGCPEIVEELRDILRDMGTHQLILHPYPTMDSRIALTAWTKMLTMDEVDRERIEEFINAYRGIDHHK